MKKQNEQQLFQNFQSSYKGMPAGTADFYESPDILFTTLAGQLIGIEITEAIYDEKHELQSIRILTGSGTKLRKSHYCR